MLFVYWSLFSFHLCQLWRSSLLSTEGRKTSCVQCTMYMLCSVYIQKRLVMLSLLQTYLLQLLSEQRIASFKPVSLLLS